MNKENISLTTKKVSIGIDVHKKTFYISVVRDGQKVKQLSIPPTSEQLLSFINNNYKDCEVEVCYEAGFSGYWLYRDLTLHGIKTVVVNPSSIEIASRDRVKTDKKDSLKLAMHLNANRLSSIFIPSLDREKMRLISRSRYHVVRKRTSVKNQIRMKLHQFGLIDYMDVRELSKKMVNKCLERAIDNRELNQVINLWLSNWSFLDQQIRELEKELLSQSKVDERIDKVWSTLPGFGLITTRILSNELGDMSQFQNEKQLFSYLGLTPREYSSGDKIKRGHITRQGNVHIRAILIEAAWRAIKIDPVLEKHYKKLSVRRGGKRAIVAVARKMVGRARAAFKTGRYEINYTKNNG